MFNAVFARTFLSEAALCISCLMLHAVFLCINAGPLAETSPQVRCQASTMELAGVALFLSALVLLVVHADMLIRMLAPGP